MTNRDEERPIDPDLPPEEDIDPADVDERVEMEPEEQRNYTDQNPDDEDAEDS